MAEKNILFVAAGGSRRRGVVEAAGRVVAAGGRATVVIGDPAEWERDPLDPQVKVVALWPVERRRIPLRIERGLVYTIPGAVARVVGGRRTHEWYRHRVADRVHRRVTLPAIRSLFGDARQLLLAELVRAVAPHLIVVADAASIPLVAGLLGSHPLTGRVTFNVGDACPS